MLSQQPQNFDDFSERRIRTTTAVFAPKSFARTGEVKRMWSQECTTGRATRHVR